MIFQLKKDIDNLNLQLVKSSDKMHLTEGLKDFTEEITKEEKNLTQIKSKSKVLVTIFETIGSVGTPLIKIVNDILAHFKII